MRLHDKVAIVTGAGCGFGEGIAKLYAAEGAKVLVADIDGGRAERVAGEIGKAARASTADVAKGPDFARLVEEATSAFGRLDIVVNNAGITYRNKPMLDVDEATVIDPPTESIGVIEDESDVPITEAEAAEDWRTKV